MFGGFSIKASDVDAFLKSELYDDQLQLTFSYFKIRCAKITCLSLLKLKQTFQVEVKLILKT